MTTLATHPIDEPDLLDELALVSDPSFLAAVKRYATKCHREGDCLVADVARYGDVSWSGRRMSAHRAAFIASRRQAIPEGLVVRHTCDRKQCVEPTHLELGTQSQNIRDQRRTGTNRYSRNVGNDNHCALLSPDLVVQMRRAVRGGQSCRTVAAAFGMPYAAVVRAVRGRTWAHVTEEPPVPPAYRWPHRNPRLTPESVRRDALRLAEQGLTLAEIAERIGTSRDTAYQLTREPAP